MTDTRPKALDIIGNMLPVDLAAIRNGATVAELEEVIYHAAGYVGFPASASAREVAREALAKAGMLA
jgi:Carboxymuconolactone decarboxylase family